MPSAINAKCDFAFIAMPFALYLIQLSKLIACKIRIKNYINITDKSIDNDNQKLVPCPLQEKTK